MMIVMVGVDEWCEILLLVFEEVGLGWLLFSFFLGRICFFDIKHLSDEKMLVLWWVGLALC